MPTLLYLVAPVLLALLAACAAPWVRKRPHQAAIVLALLGLIGCGSALAFAAGDGAQVVSWEWVPALGVDFALQLDSFRSLFLALIFGTAAGIFLFTGGAYRTDPRLPSLLAVLLLFTASMVGIVLADDFFLLFMFWEATSLFSFLLIGWYHRKEKSRWFAAQALLVTALGGLALLAGLILLRTAAGTGSLSALAGLDLADHSLTPAIIILIGLGALTKSAQFPFHFWLPNAMAGPTPVSAFLHSATMVKAGVFLLAVLAPTLGGHPLWLPLFFTCGLLTVVVAVIRGWIQTDLKAILASTTLAALGHLTILAAIGTPAALQAFVIFLVAHALYKAPLFLSCGVLEKAYDTRSVSGLRGALFTFPVTGVAVAISLISLLGVPVLPGFVGKEYLLKSTWAISPWLAVVAAASFAAVIALALRAFAPLGSRGNLSLPSQRPPRSLELSAWISAGFTILLTACFPWLAPGLFASAASALGAGSLKPLQLWPGWSPVLALSAGALVLGLLIAKYARYPRPSEREEPFLDVLYRTLFETLGRLSKGVEGFLQNHTLHVHLALVLLASGLLVGVQLLMTGLPVPDFTFEASSAVPAVLAILIAVAGLSAASARNRLELLALLGLLGLLIALLYSYFSAPDLALTQLLTETVLLVFLVAVLRKVPGRSQDNSRRAPLALPIAILGGVIATAVVLKAKALEFAPPVSSYFTERSLSEAYGANVVNVILVDFRALDTLGEIAVLAIAAIAASSLLRRHVPQQSFNPTDSPWLRTALPILLIPLAIFAALFFLRGHNNPGGGFIAALVAATAFGFMGLIGAPSRAGRLDLALVLGGLALATVTGILSTLAGRPFLTGLWVHPSLPGSESSSHFGTPLLFDLGVSLTVLGFALAFLRRFLLTSRPRPTWN